MENVLAGLDNDKPAGMTNRSCIDMKMMVSTILLISAFDSVGYH